MDDNEYENHRPEMGTQLSHPSAEEHRPQAGLKVKDDLEIEVRERALVLRPHLRRAYRLEDLVKRMTQRNVNKKLNICGPMGREAL